MTIPGWGMGLEVSNAMCKLKQNMDNGIFLEKLTKDGTKGLSIKLLDKKV